MIAGKETRMTFRRTAAALLPAATEMPRWADAVKKSGARPD